MTSDQNTDEQLLTEFQVQLIRPTSERVALHVDATAQYYWRTPFSQTGDHDLRFSGELTRATLAFEGDQWRGEGGWQPIHWGEITGAGVLDIASPEKDMLSSDLGRAKQSQLSLTTSEKGRYLSTQLFLTPWPVFNEFPEVPKEALQAAQTKALPELGVRLTYDAERARMSTYGAFLSPNRRWVDPIGSDSGDVPQSFALLGFSIGYPLGSLRVQAELAYKMGLTPASRGPVPTRWASARNRVDAAMGLEYSTDRAGAWQGFLVIERWLDDTGLTTSQATANRLALGWKDAYLNHRLNLAISAHSAMEERAVNAGGQIRYAWANEWNLGFKFMHFVAGDDMKFAPKDGDTQFQVWVEHRS